MVKDFNFIKDVAALDTFIGYAVWELNIDEECYVIFKYSIDLKDPSKIEIESEISYPEKGEKEILCNIDIVLDLLECSEEDFVKKIQQSVKVISLKCPELSDYYEQMTTMFDITDIHTFYSDISYIIKEREFIMKIRLSGLILSVIVLAGFGCDRAYEHPVCHSRE